MREQRWESVEPFRFEETLELADRLSGFGLSPVAPGREGICYVEDWAVPVPAALAKFGPWHREDVTLIRLHEEYVGDFFLLAGGYHQIYREIGKEGAYCSISHPWITRPAFSTLHAGQMLWLGFRGEQSFIRLRLQTRRVVTPGEAGDVESRETWLEERSRVFSETIEILDLPLKVRINGGRVAVENADGRGALFCSWPDAFGPSQIEYNISDAFDLLVPASRLAATTGGKPVGVRAYLTGFAPDELERFGEIKPDARLLYRLSAHVRLADLPGLLRSIAPSGRLYTTLCEFRTKDLIPEGHEAWAIVGIVGAAGEFSIEARLSRTPLSPDDTAAWLARLIGKPVRYATLPPFPLEDLPCEKSDSAEGARP